MVWRKRMNKYLVENLFGIEGWNIAWYGVIIASGMVLAVLLASYRCRQTGFDKNKLFDLIIILIPVAVICARIYYVAFEWDDYRGDILKIISIWKGGLAIYGGVIGGIVAAFIFCRIKKLSFFQLADTVMPSLVLGQAIGRWGNFVNQEAFGNLITDPKLQFFPYGVYIDALSEWHQATFFYESALNIALFILMICLYPKFKKVGYLLPVYMIGYGLIRFLVEGLRTDSLYLFPGIRVSQALSLVLIPCGIALAAIIHYRKGNGSTPKM
jgi:phosphatidylglycerol:prolipoprotein diacylglycerol transferase